MMTNQREAFDAWFIHNYEASYFPKSTATLVFRAWQASQAHQADEIAQLQLDNAKLRDKASAVVTRWNSPLWKDLPHTGMFIHELNEALSTTTQSLVEPVFEFIKPFRQYESCNPLAGEDK